MQVEVLQQQHKIVKPCSRLSTAHGQPRHHAHRKTQQKPTWPWPLTLKFNRILEVVEVYVHAKFHQATCSGS